MFRILATIVQDEWTAEIKETFRKITEGSETLMMTVEAVKSDKAHYGFKSRLNVSTLMCGVICALEIYDMYVQYIQYIHTILHM